MSKIGQSTAVCVRSGVIFQTGQKEGESALLFAHRVHRLNIGPRTYKYVRSGALPLAGDQRKINVMYDNRSNRDVTTLDTTNCRIRGVKIRLRRCLRNNNMHKSYRGVQCML